MVLDVGTHTIRLGYSGDDTPSVIVPSSYSLGKDGQMKFGEFGLGFPREGSEILPIFRFREESSNELELTDKEALVALLKWAVEDRLQTKGAVHPVLLVDSPLWTKELRETIISLLFERLEVPALFLGRSPVVSAFASGKHTGLIVDLGASSVTVSPVFDGYVVKSAVAWQKALGGNALSAQCKAMLEENGLAEQAISALPIEVIDKKPVNLGADAEFSRKNVPAINGSFRSFHQGRLLEDLKESILQVSESGIANEADIALRPPKYFEFPTGYNRNFGFDRFRLGEILFQPNKYGYSAPTKDRQGDQIMSETATAGLVTGLSDMIQRAVQGCDVDLRPSMVASVMLCGGGASIAGLSERLNADLNRMPTFGRVRVQVPTTSNERRNAAWIGGSILASLGSFHQLWLTKQEFQEHGASFIERKSP